jgi:hypothetical protein
MWLAMFERCRGRVAATVDDFKPQTRAKFKGGSRLA